MYNANIMSGERQQGSACDEGRPRAHWSLDPEGREDPSRYRVRCQSRLPAPLLGEPRMKQKRAVPAFKSEAEEAEWWYKNRARLDKDLVDAAKNLKRLDQATLNARLAASRSRVI